MLYLLNWNAINNPVSISPYKISTQVHRSSVTGLDPIIDNTGRIFAGVVCNCCDMMMSGLILALSLVWTNIDIMPGRNVSPHPSSHLVTWSRLSSSYDCWAEQIFFPGNNCISLFFITHYKDEEINPLDVLGNREAWRLGTKICLSMSKFDILGQRHKEKKNCSWKLLSRI